MTHERVAIGMDVAECLTLLRRARIMTVATHSADGTIHLVPMWYAMDGDHPVMWTNGRSQKVVNLRRDPRLTVLVEEGDTYTELAGVQAIGRAELVEDYASVLRIGRTVAARYDLPAPPELLEYQATKRVGIRITADRFTSWDHSKLVTPG